MAWYVVYRGRVPGVYSSWAMANAQVSGFSNNSHQSFPTREEAEASYLEFSGGDALPLLDNAPPPTQNIRAILLVGGGVVIGVVVLVFWIILH